MSEKELSPHPLRDHFVEEIEYHRLRIKFHENEIKRAKRVLKSAGFNDMEDNDSASDNKDVIKVKNHAKVTKGMVLDFLEEQATPVQNKDIVNHYFPNVDKEEHNKYMNRFSVVLDTLKKERKILAERETGTKGNFYRLNKDILPN